MIQRVKNWLNSLRPILVATLGKWCVKLILSTCKITFKGIETFCEIAAKGPSILMLWHNRLIITPEILSRFTPQFNYAAFVSKSKDGEMLSRIVHSYKNGSTITVPHNDRFGALQQFILCLKNSRQIAVITPDGPRGPRYTLKPGVAVAALEVGATVFALDWESTRCWKLKTWDRLRIPMPFSTIEVTFGPPLFMRGEKEMTLDEAKKILKEALSHGD